MATGVTSWSTAAGSNASADQNVNWAEGMAPSQVNDSARAMMSSVALYRIDNAGLSVGGGAPSAYTFTSSQGFNSVSSLVGARLAVRFAFGNISANATLSVDGLTPLALTYDGTTAITTGSIIASSVWDVVGVSTSAFVVIGLSTK